MSASNRVLRKEDWFHADGFPVEVARREPQEPFGLHSHEFSEIVIVTAGSGRHVTESESWVLSAGDAFVINGPEPHDYQDMSDLHLINILFDPGPLEMSKWGLSDLAGFHVLFELEPSWRIKHRFRSRLRLNARDLRHAEALAGALSDELQRRAAGFRCVARALFMQLVGFMSRCYQNHQHPDSVALLRLAETISYIENNLCCEISVDELAAMAEMSRRSFLRAFNAATGSSPISHIILLRIRKAAELLRRGEASVTQVAFDVGFNDSNYFSRQFRRIVGVSPRKYREQFASD